MVLRGSGIVSSDLCPLKDFCSLGKQSLLLAEEAAKHNKNKTRHHDTRLRAQ
jgi:hypothetical protein